MLKIKLYSCLGGDEQYQKAEYSTGLAYLKANCIGADIEIVKDRAQLVDCDLIGLSAVAAGLKEAVKILESTNIPIAIGGQGTLWEGLDKFPFKYIVHGEGEIALQNIIDGKTNGEKHIRCENIPDLDILKHPAIGELKKNVEEVPILTSRGCPYNCNFCSSRKYWGKVRWHSAQYVYDEAQELSARYPKARALYILDDLFIANKKRFYEMYELWMKDGFNKRFLIRSFVRSDLITADIAHKLKDMGWIVIRFGLESASPRILKVLNKGTTVEQAQRCIDICHEAGIYPAFTIMSYCPTETPIDRQLTAQFVVRNRKKSRIAGNYVFQPFPGTKFYKGEDALEMKWLTR